MRIGIWIYSVLKNHPNTNTNIIWFQNISRIQIRISLFSLNYLNIIWIPNYSLTSDPHRGYQLEQLKRQLSLFHVMFLCFIYPHSPLLAELLRWRVKGKQASLIMSLPPSSIRKSVENMIIMITTIIMKMSWKSQKGKCSISSSCCRCPSLAMATWFGHLSGGTLVGRSFSNTWKHFHHMIHWYLMLLSW